LEEKSSSLPVAPKEWFPVPDLIIGQSSLWDIQIIKNQYMKEYERPPAPVAPSVYTLNDAEKRKNMTKQEIDMWEQEAKRKAEEEAGWKAKADAERSLLMDNKYWAFWWERLNFEIVDTMHVLLETQRRIRKELYMLRTKGSAGGGEVDLTRRGGSPFQSVKSEEAKDDDEEENLEKEEGGVGESESERNGDAWWQPVPFMFRTTPQTTQKFSPQHVVRLNNIMRSQVSLLHPLSQSNNSNSSNSNNKNKSRYPPEKKKKSTKSSAMYVRGLLDWDRLVDGMWSKFLKPDGYHQANPSSVVFGQLVVTELAMLEWEAEERRKFEEMERKKKEKEEKDIGMEVSVKEVDGEEVRKQWKVGKWGEVEVEY
jgi:hypothetical protein